MFNTKRGVVEAEILSKEKIREVSEPIEIWQDPEVLAVCQSKGRFRGVV